MNDDEHDAGAIINARRYWIKGEENGIHPVKISGNSFKWARSRLTGDVEAIAPNILQCDRLTVQEMNGMGRSHCRMLALGMLGGNRLWGKEEEAIALQDGGSMEDMEAIAFCGRERTIANNVEAFMVVTITLTFTAGTRSRFCKRGLANTKNDKRPPASSNRYG